MIINYIVLRDEMTAMSFVSYMRYLYLRHEMYVTTCKKKLVNLRVNECECEQKYVSAEVPGSALKVMNNSKLDLK